MRIDCGGKCGFPIDVEDEAEAGTPFICPVCDAVSVLWRSNLVSRHFLLSPLRGKHLEIACVVEGLW